MPLATLCINYVQASAVVPADGTLLRFLLLSCTLVLQSASVPGLDEQLIPCLRKYSTLCYLKIIATKIKFVGLLRDKKGKLNDSNLKA